MKKWHVKYVETVYHDVLVEAPDPKAAFQQVAYGYTTPEATVNIIYDDCNSEMEEPNYEVVEDGKPDYYSEYAFTFTA